MSLSKKTKQAFVGGAALLAAAMPFSALAHDFDGARAQPVASYTIQNESRLVERSDGVLWYQQGGDGRTPTGLVTDESEDSNSIIIYADGAPDNVMSLVAGAQGLARWLKKQPGIYQNVIVAASNQAPMGKGALGVYRNGVMFTMNNRGSFPPSVIMEHLGDIAEWSASQEAASTQLEYAN